MRTSDSIKAISTALAAFQKEVKQPVKNETADTGKFKYDYITLDALMEHVKPLMEKHGLLFTACGFECRMIHVPSSEWMEGDFPLNTTGLDAQKIGGACTYSRRYGLQAFLGIVAEEDDDAAKASAPAKVYNLKPTTPPVQPIQGSGPYHPPAPKAAAPQPDGGDMIQATVLATSKARNDSGSYGILVKDSDHQGSCPKISDNRAKCSCGAERWLNTFHDTPWNTAKALKGQVGVFTMSAPNERGYSNVEHLVGVQG